MTHTEMIREAYSFPFEFRPFQTEMLNVYGQNTRKGYYDEAGSGKTIISIAHALILIELGKAERWFVVMPPILIPNWQKVIHSVIDKSTGEPVSCVAYRGSKKEREAIDILTSKFVLMSYDILKNDFDALASATQHQDVGVICDEAHKIKNVDSASHKHVHDMFLGQPMLLLTGTPITSPKDAYAYIRFTDRTAYRNERHFHNIHDGEIDEHKQVISYLMLELLSENLLRNSTRSLKIDHLKELPKVEYTSFSYELEPSHLKLYRKIASEKLIELEDGGLIDGAQKILHSLQQIIMNYGHFASNPSLKSNGLTIAEEVLDEIGSKKLLIVVNYRITSDLLTKELSAYNPARIYGGMTSKQQEFHLSKFINEADCRVLIIQPEAAGYGIDGLQHVCSDILFLECPTVPRQFYQCTARIDRSGQKIPVTCRIAVAEKTLQVRKHRQLLVSDQLINSIQGSHQDLRDMIYGD